MSVKIARSHDLFCVFCNPGLGKRAALPAARKWRELGVCLIKGHRMNAGSQVILAATDAKFPGLALSGMNALCAKWAG